MSRLFERNTAWCRSLTGERACENHANARRKALAVASGERARLRTDAAVREAALRIQNTRCGTTRFSRRCCTALAKSEIRLWWCSGSAGR